MVTLCTPQMAAWPEDMRNPDMADWSLGLPSKCAWQSISPGTTVYLERSMSFMSAGTVVTMRVIRSFSTTIYALVVTWPVRTSMRRPARIATDEGELDFSVVGTGADCDRTSLARSQARKNATITTENFKLVFTWAPGS